MIRGIIILESGEVQQIGELQSLTGIVNTMKRMLPELIAQDRKRALADLSAEDIERIAAEIKAEQEKQLEP